MMRRLSLPSVGAGLLVAASSFPSASADFSLYTTCFNFNDYNSPVQQQQVPLDNQGQILFFPFQYKDTVHEFQARVDNYTSATNIHMYMLPDRIYLDNCKDTDGGATVTCDNETGECCYDGKANKVINCLFAQQYQQTSEGDAFGGNCALMSLTLNGKATWKVPPQKACLDENSTAVPNLGYLIAVVREGGNATTLTVRNHPADQSMANLIYSILLMLLAPPIALWAAETFNICIMPAVDGAEEKEEIFAGTFKERLQEIATVFSFKIKTEEHAFVGLLFLMATASISTNAMFVLGRWAAMNKSGDRDMCTYNAECFTVINGVDLPGNKILSHIGYFITAIHIFHVLARHELHNKEIFKKEERRPDLGVFWALALAIFLEGIGSMFYHICPGESTFQFDTMFMIPISHLSVLALYDITDPHSKAGRAEELRRSMFDKEAGTELQPVDDSARSGSAKPRDSLMQPTWTARYVKARFSLDPLYFFLFVTSLMWIISAVGTFFDQNEIYDPAYHVFQFLVIVWAFVVIFPGFGGLRGDNDPFLASLIFWGWQLVMFSGVAAVTLSEEIRNNNAVAGFPNFFLLLSIGNMLFITIYCIVVYDLLNFWLPGQSCLMAFLNIFRRYALFVVFAPVAAFSLQFFYDKQSGYDVTPGLSRNMNKGCDLWLYDKHDLWHLGSAITLGLWTKIILSVKTHFYTSALCRTKASRSGVGSPGAGS